MTGASSTSSAGAQPGGITREFSSFRDPAGHLVWRDGAIYRIVGLAYQSQFTRATESGLYADCTRDRLLLPFEEQPDTFAADGAHTVIKPAPLAQITYPYEWCFDQLKDAALLTLAVHKRALMHGMVLKDASAYNVQFVQGAPCLIDHLSFDHHSDHGMWPAYGQFCRHFLAPLALMSHVDLRLVKLLQSCLDGVPLDLASRLLPFRTRFNPGTYMHLHLHAAMIARYAGIGRRVAPPSLKPARLLDLAASLERAVGRLAPRRQATEWADYYRAQTSYSAPALAARTAAVREMVRLVRPRVVWDVGGNDGSVSRAIADLVERILCLDVDPAAVNANYAACKGEGVKNVIPLLVDWTNPSPALGFGNQERRALKDRGPADLVLALALLHHLVIPHNLPLDYVARHFSEVGSHLLIEYVPKSDAQVRRLLSNRKDIFDHYTEDQFRAAFSRWFSILREQPVPHTGRALFLMKRRAA